MWVRVRFGQQVVRLVHDLLHIQSTLSHVGRLTMLKKASLGHVSRLTMLKKASLGHVSRLTMLKKAWAGKTFLV